MTIFAIAEAPPTDFVAFLAQRGGLSPEAAEHRLELWLGEYQASSSKRPPSPPAGDRYGLATVSA
jgi:hypothetical protein